MRTRDHSMQSLALRVCLTAGLIFGTTTNARMQPLELGHWFAQSPLPMARSEVGVTALGGRIYVVGGFTPDGDQRATLEYDAARDSWRLRHPLPRGLNHIATAAYQGKLYAFGG